MIIRTPPKITNKKSLVQFIEVQLWSWLRDLANSLLKIDFIQNFQSFEVTNLKIPANTEVAITNQFSLSYPGRIPSKRIITRQQGNAIIIDGNTVWTQNQLFLRNVSSNDATISVIFFL